ncbi:MAG: peptide chain release factor 2 [Candidatus Wildermuthbacteria bacterium]|nr:peptide chain release factor 2 [Candidatus Wildermuthbacteria bacterium]
MAKQKERIIELLAVSEKPEFWEDPKEAAKKSKELAEAKEIVEKFDAFVKELGDMKELIALAQEDEEAAALLDKQLQDISRRLSEEEFRVFLAGRYDKSSAILTITAGAGGQDAQDWAGILLRMYQRYCEKKGWKTAILDQSFGEPNPEGRIGVKQVSFEVLGSYAYGFLRGEHGVHRLVRISPFSAQQLRHTSFASVEVLPKISLAQEKDIEIRPEDIHTDVFRSSGPGGQNVNKRETAIRLTHTPTGIVVACQSQRNQQQNKEKALEILAAKLYQLREQEKAKELAKLKGEKFSIEWGSQIRSYVLHPYTLVKDHRTGVETSDAAGVLDGEIGNFLEAEIKM